MMPSGHTCSGLEVAALLRRWSLSAALLLLTLSLEVELFAVKGRNDYHPFIRLLSLIYRIADVLVFPSSTPEFVLLALTVSRTSSLLRASLNMRRSSSSSAISPRKAAAETVKHTAYAAV